MAHHQSPREQERTDSAEAFLKYVGVAGIALTALLTLGLVAGLLVFLVPTNEAIGTVVFTGLLLAGAYAASRYGTPRQR